MRNCYYCRHCKATMQLKNVMHKGKADKMIVWKTARTRCAKEMWILGNGRLKVLKRLPTSPYAVNQLQAAERCPEFERL